MLFQDYHAIGEIKFPSTLSKGWWFPKATPLVAHRSERNLPSPGRRICSKPSLRTQLTSRPPPSFPLSPSHPRPRRLCRQANRSRLYLSPSLSILAPSRQRPTFVGLVPCLAARKRTAPRGSAPKYPGAVPVGAARVALGAPDVGWLPLLAVTRPGEAGSVRPRR